MFFIFLLGGCLSLYSPEAVQSISECNELQEVVGYGAGTSSWISFERSSCLIDAALKYGPEICNEMNDTIYMNLWSYEYAPFEEYGISYSFDLKAKERCLFKVAIDLSDPNICPKDNPKVYAACHLHLYNYDLDSCESLWGEAKWRCIQLYAIKEKNYSLCKSTEEHLDIGSDCNRLFYSSIYS